MADPIEEAFWLTMTQEMPLIRVALEDIIIALQDGLGSGPGGESLLEVLVALTNAINLRTIA